MGQLKTASSSTPPCSPGLGHGEADYCLSFHLHHGGSPIEEMSSTMNKKFADGTIDNNTARH